MAVDVKHPSAGFGEIFVALVHGAGAFVRGVLERRQRRRQAAQTYDLLCRLDDRTLRDIGFHGEEIWSVAAEIADLTERTRVRSRHY